MAIKIPAIKKTASTHEVEYVDGITITVEGANNATTRKPLYIKAKEAQKLPPVVVPTPKVTDLARDIFVMEDALVISGLAISVPSRKGGENLVLAGVKPKLGSAKYIPSIKGIFIDNEPECWYETAQLAKQYPLPSEICFIVNVASFFDYESPFNIYGIYIGLRYGRIRLMNGEYSPLFPEAYVIPTNENVLIRMRYLANGDGEVWINNKKLTGSIPSFFSGQKQGTTRLGFGTPQNNSFYNYIAIYGFDKLLSDIEVNDLYNELSATYNLGKKSTAPIIENCGYTVNNGIAKMSGNYSGSSPEAFRTVKWVTAGNGNIPDVTNGIYDHRLDGKSEFKISDYGLNGYHIRPVVQLTDTNNVTGAPTSKGYIRLPQ